jgi:hypothetical protein
MCDMMGFFCGDHKHVATATAQMLVVAYPSRFSSPVVPIPIPTPWIWAPRREDPDASTSAAPPWPPPGLPPPPRRRHLPRHPASPTSPQSPTSSARCSRTSAPSPRGSGWSPSFTAPARTPSSSSSAARCWRRPPCSRRLGGAAEAPCCPTARHFADQLGALQLYLGPIAERLGVVPSLMAPARTRLSSSRRRGVDGCRHAQGACGGGGQSPRTAHCAAMRSGEAAAMLRFVLPACSVGREEATAPLLFCIMSTFRNLLFSYHTSSRPQFWY